MYLYPVKLSANEGLTKLYKKGKCSIKYKVEFLFENFFSLFCGEI